MNAAGIAQQKEIDTNLKWETNEQTNIGLDMAFMNNELSFSVDYFIRNSKDLLIYRQIRPSTGFTSVYTNAGHIRNKGFEVSAAWNKSFGDWNVGVRVNGSTLKNEAVEVGDPIFYKNNSYGTQDGDDWDNHSITKNGYAVGSYYGWKVAGIFQNQQEIDALNAQSPTGKYQDGDTAPGDFKYIDLNGDGQITDEDRTVIGNPNPSHLFSINNSMTWRGFELSIYLQGVAGNKIFNANKIDLTGMSAAYNQLTEVLSRWNGEGTSNVIPRAVYSDPNGNNRISDRFVESGSYLRLKTISLSYNFPLQWVKILSVESARLTLSCENVATITGYSGFDPEVGINGIDLSSYPVSRTFNIGFNVNF